MANTPKYDFVTPSPWIDVLKGANTAMGGIMMEQTASDRQKQRLRSMAGVLKANGLAPDAAVYEQMALAETPDYGTAALTGKAATRDLSMPFDHVLKVAEANRNRATTLMAAGIRSGGTMSHRGFIAERDVNRERYDIEENTVKALKAKILELDTAIAKETNPSIRGQHIEDQNNLKAELAKAEARANAILVERADLVKAYQGSAGKGNTGGIDPSATGVRFSNDNDDMPIHREGEVPGDAGSGPMLLPNANPEYDPMDDYRTTSTTAPAARSAPATAGAAPNRNLVEVVRPDGTVVMRDINDPNNYEEARAAAGVASTPPAGQESGPPSTASAPSIKLAPDQISVTENIEPESEAQKLEKATGWTAPPIDFTKVLQAKELLILPDPAPTGTSIAPAAGPPDQPPVPVAPAAASQAQAQAAPTKTTPTPAAPPQRVAAVGSAPEWYAGPIGQENLAPFKKSTLEDPRFIRGVQEFEGNRSVAASAYSFMAEEIMQAKNPVQLKSMVDAAKARKGTYGFLTPEDAQKAGEAAKALIDNSGDFDVVTRLNVDTGKHNYLILKKGSGVRQINEKTWYIDRGPYAGQTFIARGGFIMRMNPDGSEEKFRLLDNPNADVPEETFKGWTVRWHNSPLADVSPKLLNPTPKDIHQGVPTITPNEKTPPKPAGTTEWERYQKKKAAEAQQRK